jgi:hypothetical protein
MLLRLLPPLFSISQNPAKDQAMAALPPVAALMFIVLMHTYVYQYLLFGGCNNMKYCVVHKNVFCFWKKMSGVDGMIAPLLVSRISGKTLDRAGSNKSPP